MNTESSISGLKILLVENDELNIKFLNIVLGKLGHKTDVAVNGLIAIDSFKNNKYDLVLMDLEMPKLNGLDATKAIRTIEKKQFITNPVKIIAVTAYAMETDRQRCFAVGMNDFLAKPFHLSELTKIIEKHFSGKTTKDLLSDNLFHQN